MDHREPSLEADVGFRGQSPPAQVGALKTSPECPTCGRPDAIVFIEDREPDRRVCLACALESRGEGVTPGTRLCESPAGRPRSDE